MEKKNNKKGFTLAELLIVVAIIAVLVAIAIPVFSAQLEKSREATDVANIRSAYAEVVAAGLDNSLASHGTSVTLKQQQKGWQTKDSTITIAGVKLSALESLASKNGKVQVKFVPASGSASAYVWIGSSGKVATTGYTVN